MRFSSPGSLLGAVASPWERFAAWFAGAAAAAALGLFGFVFVADPYGTRVGPKHPPRPIMDLNQRYMYPQIVRSGRYDSAVFGTSTIRLTDPQQLGELFGARFANLGLNAGTPWEQVELAMLFLRHVPHPKVVVWGLDPTWCEPDADRKRLTFRPFPPWLYDEDRWNDLPGLFNLTSVEIAGRIVLHAMGLMPSRIREDGYEVFVPPESAYDLERARAHIHAGALPESTAAAPAPQAPGPEPATPALAWLDALLARIPKGTETILLFPPVHAVLLPPEGSAGAAIDETCKRRVAGIARARGATLLDFKRRSGVTMDDSNYWDALHYRIGIADRIARALYDAQTKGAEPADGFYTVRVAGGSEVERSRP
jgi:hypothetical protein